MINTLLIMLLTPVSIFIIHNIIGTLFINRILQSKPARFAYISTAAIGTPLHELSHAVMCILFGHRIKEIKLFTLNNGSNIGYVRHSYNPTSILHQIGVFFIAIAPMITAMVLCGLFFDTKEPSTNIFTSSSIITTAHQALNESLAVVFHSLQSTGNFITLILISSICFHCIPSNTDFKNAGKGSIYVLVSASLCIALAQSVYPTFATPLNVLIYTVTLLSNFVVPMLATYMIASLFWICLIALSFLGKLRSE